MLAKYLTPAAPTPPAAVDYAAAVKAWGMLGNDTVGDCALAGQAHADMLWAANAEHRQLAITTAMVLGAYSDVTGYDPHDDGPGGNPTDRGTALLDALKYWRTRGIDRQTIKAFVEVDTQLDRERQARHRPVRLPVRRRRAARRRAAATGRASCPPGP